MSNPEPTIRINVDATNPGQFFACCGLLELAGRIDPHALGCFADGCFLIQGNVASLLDCLFDCVVDVDTSAIAGAGDVCDGEDGEASIDAHRGRTHPMRLLHLSLDWWNNEDAQEQKLKTWTAGQRVTDLLIGHHKKRKLKGKTYLAPIPSMREHFADAVKKYPNDWLRKPLPIAAPMAFSYDSRLSRNNALDLGHTNAGVLAFSPAVDVLTLIAFQRFRPLMLAQWSRNLFCTWRQPIPVEIAAVAAIGVIPQLIDGCYEFPIMRRDSQGRFKLFGHAQPARRSHV